MNEREMLRTSIKQALAEDLGSHGDITSQAIFSKNDHTTAVIKSKENGTLSGAYLIEPVYKEIDSSLSIEIAANDGSLLNENTEICRIKGSIQSILTGERTVLNFLQRLSGIATSTANLVSLVKNTETRILDTRKTTPSLRFLEKKAVMAGGGINHRFGLFDMILIKDTHVQAAGGPFQAVMRAKEFRTSNYNVAIEVEVQSVDEFHDAFRASPDRIMLDNMSIDDMVTCVTHIKKSKSDIELEASGNVTAENISAIAHTGVDFISTGSITHSPRALDIHLILV